MTDSMLLWDKVSLALASIIGSIGLLSTQQLLGWVGIGISLWIVYHRYRWSNLLVKLTSTRHPKKAYHILKRKLSRLGELEKIVKERGFDI